MSDTVDTFCPWIIGRPCLPVGEWADWSQVLVAVVIGFAAIYVPWQMSRAQTQRRITTSLTLCGITLFQFLQAAKLATDRSGDTQLYRYHRTCGMDMLNSLRQIPTHELIDWDVIHARIHLEMRCVQLIEYADNWHIEQEGFARLPDSTLDELAHRIGLLHASLDEVRGLLLRRRMFWPWLSRRVVAFERLPTAPGPVSRSASAIR